MSRLTRQVFIGATLACGLGLNPTLAQHEGHTHGHGERQHAGHTSATAVGPKCPITDEPANLAVSTETSDGPVFFCCKSCISKYQNDPAKYAEKVAAQRRALADRPKVQVTCPVSRKPVDRDVFLDTEGGKVYFCCKGCISKYQKDPTDYASALANSYTYQTKCPVMGEDINPKVFASAGNGGKIYFCCKGCDKKFFKEPQKYAPNLAAQGLTVHAKDMAHEADDQADHDHGSQGHDSHNHDH